MENCGDVVCGVIGGVFILVFFFGVAFAPQIAAYLNAKTEQVRALTEEIRARKERQTESRRKRHCRKRCGTWSTR